MRDEQGADGQGCSKDISRGEEQCRQNWNSYLDPKTLAHFTCVVSSKSHYEHKSIQLEIQTKYFTQRL